MHPSESTDSTFYERGDALVDILSPTSGNGLPAEATPEDLDQRSEVYELSEQEYWKWLAAMMQEGTNLDEHLDDILEDIYVLEPAFYDRDGQRRLQRLLGQLHAARTSVRAFEQDVEQLSFVFSQSNKIDTEAANNAELALSSIKRTYDRAYDLCLYKLDRISNGWITVTNVLISLTILIVTILFWMEFWE